MVQSTTGSAPGYPLRDGRLGRGLSAHVLRQARLYCCERSMSRHGAPCYVRVSMTCLQWHSQKGPMDGQLCTCGWARFPRRAPSRKCRPTRCLVARASDCREGWHAVTAASPRL